MRDGADGLLWERFGRFGMIEVGPFPKVLHYRHHYRKLRLPRRHYHGGLQGSIFPLPKEFYSATTT